MNTPQTEVADQWVFPSVARLQYGKYTSYRIEPTDETYKTGRPKFKCVFFNKQDGFEYATHDALEFINKKTKENCYSVFAVSDRMKVINNKKEQERQVEIRKQIITEEELCKEIIKEIKAEETNEDKY